MKSITSLFSVAGVIFLICTGIWLYSDWDLRHFKESLPTPPQKTEKVSIERLDNSPASRNTANGRAHLFPTELDTTHIAPEPSGLESESTIDGEQTGAIFNTDMHITKEELTDEYSLNVPVSDAPYDMLFVKRAYKDYNTYLHKDPEYAYQRLDEAFREQFGDDSDVDIFVESVRRYNEGSVPIDTAIRYAEAKLRLTSKLGDSESIAALKDHIEMLQEAQQYALESGEDVVCRNHYRFVSE